MSGECLSFCPHITVCREQLLADSQVPSPTKLQETVNKLDDLTNAIAEVAVNACASGPQIEEQMVEKGGFWQSKKLIPRRVYVCGRDNYAPPTQFTYQEDKMPR